MSDAGGKQVNGEVAVNLVVLEYSSEVCSV